LALKFRSAQPARADEVIGRGKNCAAPLASRLLLAFRGFLLQVRRVDGGDRDAARASGSAAAAFSFSMILAITACPARSNTARFSITNFCDLRNDAI
jgi:hypothetical protein